ncbi:D-ribose-binding periplasmic protein precursor [Posidoniimonas polymericola]|uniref:D-ribose-binding periplasmic protein n=1 Tax=Posidoniimonas polymericola TaxID=2528002 RepID=A0A5C5YUK2_9BACT|nr:substrate-binding domain-containing protein [Posidoniimonas polymericola]TWT78343.1 D-ribose-binding periplasmic protein precursor [Posidoniimonas polymericola]
MCRPLLLCVFVLPAALIGCSSDSSTPADEGGSPGAAAWTIGVSQCNLGEPWRVQMDADLKRAAESHPEVQLQFNNAENDTLKQRAQIEEFVSAGVDLLIVSPKEAQPLTEPIAKAYDAGIPVIVLDRRVLRDAYTCFIGADNREIGRAAGRWIAEHAKPDAKIVELQGLMTSVPAQDRHSGFLDGLGEAGQVIFAADMQWLEPQARKEMDSALARFDEIDVVYAHNDPGAHGAYLAAKAAGRDEEMLFVGIDALPHEGVAYVKQGILDATFEYPTGGRKAIETAISILNGEEVPKNIVLEYATIEQPSQRAAPAGL